MNRSKPILLVDFDGVIHSYERGWQGVSQVADGPVPGAFEFLEKALDHFDVQIYSARSQDPAGVMAMERWFSNNGAGRLLSSLSFPTQKPPAFLTIDDRAIQFEGTFPRAEDLLGFKPWNK